LTPDAGHHLGINQLLIARSGTEQVRKASGWTTTIVRFGVFIPAPATLHYYQ